MVPPRFSQARSARPVASPPGCKIVSPPGPHFPAHIFRRSGLSLLGSIMLCEDNRTIAGSTAQRLKIPFDEAGRWRGRPRISARTAGLHRRGHLSMCRSRTTRRFARQGRIARAACVDRPDRGPCGPARRNGLTRLISRVSVFFADKRRRDLGNRDKSCDGSGRRQRVGRPDALIVLAPAVLAPAAEDRSSASGRSDNKEKTT